VVSGHGTKRDRWQEATIAALLTHGSVRKAARAVGISPDTICDWLKDPEWRAAYDEARRDLLRHACGRLSAEMSAAVATLRRNLKCGRPAAEVAAALGIIDRAVKGAELLDIDARLAELERRAAEHP
jgi:transposase-like protein